MIRKAVLLPVTPESAFQLFTTRISDWWPETHRPSRDPRGQLSIDPAGRFWERATDGREYELGFVRVWQPPALLVLDFYLGTDSSHPTSVTIRFESEPGGTRIRVEHSPTSESLDLWDVRAPRYQASWDAVLAAFIQLP